MAAQVRSIAGLAIDGAVRDIAAIGGCTEKETGALNCPIEFGGVCVRPGDPVFGDTDCLVIVGQDCAESVCVPALKTRENERIMIENLRKGKATLKLPGLGGAE